MENVPINKPNESEIKPFDLDKLDNELKHTEEFNNSDNSEEQTAELTNDVPEKKRNKLALKIGAAAVAVALVVVGGYQSIKMMTKPAEEVANTQGNRTQTESTQASNVISEKEQSELTTKPVENTYAGSNSGESSSSIVEANANPSVTTSAENNTASNNTETEKTGEQLVSNLEIPAGLSTEELGNKIVENFELWRNAGFVTPEDEAKLIEDWHSYTTTNSINLKDFALEEAGKNTDKFANALLVSNYKEDTDLVGLYDLFKTLNKRSIINHMLTIQDKENKAGYYLSMETFSVNEMLNTGDERMIQIAFSESINIEDLTSSKNTIEQASSDSIVCNVTVSAINGVEKITDFAWASNVDTNIN